MQCMRVHHDVAGGDEEPAAFADGPLCRGSGASLFPRIPNGQLQSELLAYNDLNEPIELSIVRSHSWHRLPNLLVWTHAELQTPLSKFEPSFNYVQSPCHAFNP